MLHRVMPGRGKRSLRPCNGRHPGSRKDVKFSHYPSVSRGERGHGQRRQLGDGEGGAATRTLFFWVKPPS